MIEGVRETDNKKINRGSIQNLTLIHYLVYGAKGHTGLKSNTYYFRVTCNHKQV